MKRSRLISIIAVVCIFVIGATLLAGCKNKNLSVPEDIKYENGMFSWSAVEGADGYIVRINDDEEIFVGTASISVSDSKISKKLLDKEVNTLWVKSVTLNEEENVDQSSEEAMYEFDYMVPKEKKWKVTFELNYADAPQAQTISVATGEKFDKPANPQRSGWKFEGWYRDQYCLISANFSSSGQNNFTVTANMTLYAKWSLDAAVATTSIYFYNDSWEQVAVKPYKGETKLFDGEGIAMAAVAGKANWFKADINATATSVIFTNGTDSTESATFDKSKPYYKDGVFTATMPVEQPDEPEHGVFIKVGSGEPQQLTENPKVAGEYMILDVTLEVGDTVVITIDGVTVSNYDADCKFTGTATIQGKHSFYVTAERIWVEAPEAPSDVSLIINGDTENAKDLKEHPCDDPTVEIQYSVTVTLKAGDTVKITIGGVECKNYEVKCGFSGTAERDGKYDFYVKKYNDGKKDSIWVTIPIEVPTASTKVYFHNSVAGHKLSSVYIYYWNAATEKREHDWPGVKMTYLGDDWYVFEIEEGYNKVIFNVGSNANQTEDLTLVVVDGCAYYDFNGVTTDRPAE